MIFAAFTALAGTWSLPPLDRDEARFAQATAQMLETGDFVTIRFQDDERNKKPAGVHWLQAASVATFSSAKARQIWAYRIPSMVGVVLAALFTCLAAMRLYDTRTGLLAGMLLASAPLIAAEATIAKTDAILLAMICLAQLAFAHLYANVNEKKETSWRTSLTFWAAHGAGVLIKGPIAPLVSLLTGLGLAAGAEKRRPRWHWLKPMRPITGVILFILMIAPWAVAIGLSTEGRFFADAIGGDMLGKVGDAQEGHVGPPGYHAVLLWILFWPAAALIAPGLIDIWRERKGWRATFFLAWLIPGWIIFEIAATKLPHYVMPLYPALAIIAARYATKAVNNGWAQKIGAAIYAAVGVFAAALLGVIALQQNASWQIIIAGLIAAAGMWIASLFWRGRPFQGGIAASILATAFAWILMTIMLPGLSQLAVSPRLSAALEADDRHPIHNNQAPVALTGFSEPSAIFLLGTETRLMSAADAAAHLTARTISAAIIEARHEDAFNAALNGRAATPIAVIDGLNYSNGDIVSLTIYVTAP